MFTASQRSSAQFTRIFIVLLCISATLIVSESHLVLVQRFRAQMFSLLNPIYWLQSQPEQLMRWSTNWFVSQQNWLNQEKIWHYEKQALQIELTELSHLRYENASLRALVNLSAEVSSKGMTARVIGTPKPNGLIRIDQGTYTGVQNNMPVIFARGIFGSVTQISANSAWVMPLYHEQHALPVEIQRSNYKTIATGTGVPNMIRLEHIPESADIRLGDTIVSSGIALRFPKGLPVGVVESIEQNSGEPFLDVLVRLSADLRAVSYLYLRSPHPAGGDDV